MERTEALDRLTNSRTGHLATVGTDGAPHLVVITFAVVDDVIVTAVDQKPKTTTRLQRLINIERDERVSFLVDHYDDDWARLWWVRVDGSARILDDGPGYESALSAMSQKYDQYVTDRPTGPVISITMDRITHWSSTP